MRGSRAEKRGKDVPGRETAPPLKPTAVGHRDSLKHLSPGRFLQSASQKLLVKTAPQAVNNGKSTILEIRTCHCLPPTMPGYFSSSGIPVAMSFAVNNQEATPAATSKVLLRSFSCFYILPPIAGLMKTSPSIVHNQLLRTVLNSLSHP